MIRAAVVTALYDNYDELKPVHPQAGADVDWVCVSDTEQDPDLGWRVVVEPRPDIHPNRAAKRPKYFPWMYTDKPASVWLDASFRVVSDQFVTGALEYAHPIAQFAHPWRDCIYDEARASEDLPKYITEREYMWQQVARYKEAGHPEHWGLWATGVIARHHAPVIKDLGHGWQTETVRGSFQDQVSEAFVLRNCGLYPVPFPGTHMDNEWIRYEGSGRH